MESFYTSALQAPTSFRLQTLAQNAYELPLRSFENAHDSHPSIGHLVLLVFEAVLEVVCVSLPGYVVARLGYFDAEKQKFLANLNVMLFTPCLIFTKLASQLNADKLSDLAIIPVIFIVQTIVSYVVSILVSRAFRFNKRASNFVTAMGVFGNSNSLPISLVLSLSQTLKGLHWDRIPGDNDEEVGARGILYLLIFQQLGQLVRWSWGYHVLLKPKDKYPEYQDQIVEEGNHREEEHDEHEGQSLLDGVRDDEEHSEGYTTDSQNYEPAGRTPVGGASSVSLATTADGDLLSAKLKKPNSNAPLDGNYPTIDVNGNDDGDDMLSFPRIRTQEEEDAHSIDEHGRVKHFWYRTKRSTKAKIQGWKKSTSDAAHGLYERSPKPVQWTLHSIKVFGGKVYNFIWEFMNPPLWAMLIAVLVASIPALQRLFFEEGSFVKNSVTHAINSNGNVAVPLILVVLGANLARNTSSREDEAIDPEEEKMGTKLLIAALISRMLLPTLIMAPLIALAAKHLPIGILDDPIFVIVCFLLSGAPSALQLAQICQINNVFEKTMGRILFQSYVVWILPSTLVLVMVALETVEWAVQ